MTKRTQWRIGLYAVLLVAALAAIAPYLPAGVFRGRVEQALARSLNRDVNIVGDVRFTFFPAGPVPGPGFTIENVTIHEDPRAGIEPFAHMQELGASIRILSLLRGRLELSGINLGDASINLVKTTEGPWNFQYLLNNLARQDSAMPALRMRAGRVNFKFGDTKSVFYFNEADLNLDPSTGGIELRFSGAPRRSDHTKQDFGRFFVRGTASASNHLDFQVELQQSSLEETLRLMDPQGFGVHGVLAFDARLTGDPSKLNVEGKLQIGDIHRSDRLPSSEQPWQLPYKGILDLHEERLNLESTSPPGAPQPIVGVRLSLWDYLKTPVWAAGMDFHEMPLATLFEVAQHMGATLPEMLTVDGSASGSAAYDQREGLTGKLSLSNASLKLPDNEPIRAEAAALEIRQGAVFLKPASITIAPDQDAQLEGSVALASPHALDLKVTTRRLNVAAMRSFGLAAMPVLGQTPKGVWKGWARYVEGMWTSESQLEGASLQLDGLAEPLKIDSATVHLTATRIRADRIAGSLGATSFTAAYEARPNSTQPAKFALTINEADAAELERLLAPTLSRAEPGFLARTLRLRAAAPAPAWLKARRAEGTVAIDSVAAGEWRARGLKAKLSWNGTALQLTDVSAQLDAAAFAGTVGLDLAAPAPKYHLEGTLNGVAYHGGALDLTGWVDAEGSGVQLFETARAEGTVKGRTVAFAPEADFRTLTAAFQLQAPGATPRWKLSNVEVTQAGATLQGSGASQEDGRLLLELTQGERQVRYTGTLFVARAAK
ncbi:MAG: AsmA family protein [Acidobacteriota bacterium]